VVLELSNRGRGAIKDECQLDAAKEGVEDIAVNEQVGRKVSFLEEELWGDLRVKTGVVLACLECSSDSVELAHPWMT